MNYRDKGVGYLKRKGTSEKRDVTNDDDGTRAGYEIEHWDDHRDAVAQPKPVRVKPKVNEEG